MGAERPNFIANGNILPSSFVKIDTTQAMPSVKNAARSNMQGMTNLPDLSMNPSFPFFLALERPSIKMEVSSKMQGMTRLPVLSMKPHFLFFFTPVNPSSKPILTKSKVSGVVTLSGVW